MTDERTSNLTLPDIGLGTMRLQGDACAAQVEAALAEGYRHLDTARKYGNEDSVGRGLARSSTPRGDVILTTKLTHLELEPAQVRACTQESLSRLGTDYVDLLLIHWPSDTVPLEATFATLEALRDEGKVRHIGVANFPSSMLHQAAGIADLVTNQVEYHPYLDQTAVLGSCRELGITLTAYCPLGRGNDLIADPTLQEIAADVGRTVPQVILRWLVQQDGVVAIPGTSSVEHLRENLAVYDFSLDEDQMHSIHGLARGERIVNPEFAPVWDA